MRSGTSQFVAAICGIVLLVSLNTGHAQESYGGYTLFSPNGGRTTTLIDEDGTTVHTWSHARSGGYSVYLLPDGNLLRPQTPASTQFPERVGGSAGQLQKIDPDGNTVWEFTYESSTYTTHHDVEMLPNGNILMIAVSLKTAAEAVTAGFASSAKVLNEHIIEVDGNGDIVWQWHSWDHIVQDYDVSEDNYGVIADHPELIDINLGSSRMGTVDWIHMNGISYNAALDQIAFSSHNLDEVFVIDHSTTTAEAAGHTGGTSGKGGDILYRWGNPANYGASGSTYFDVVHCAIWVPDSLPGGGNLMAFNNGSNARQSDIVEITPPYDSEGNYPALTSGTAYGPADTEWNYMDGTTFYSNHLGSCQRLPNGNTFICEATDKHFLEVTPAGETVWEYSPSSEVARAMRYGADYPGLAALFPQDSTAGIHSAADDVSAVAGNITVTPNPVSASAAVSFSNPGRHAEITVRSFNGTPVYHTVTESDGFTWKTDGRNGGIYIITVVTADARFSKSINVIK